MSQPVTLEQVRQLERRSHRYLFEDGIGEIAAGLLLLLITAVIGLGRIQPAFFLLLVVVLIGGPRLVSQMVRRVRSRLTFPHGGYFRGRKPTRAETIGPWIGLASYFMVLDEAAVREAMIERWPASTWTLYIVIAAVLGLVAWQNRIDWARRAAGIVLTLLVFNFVLDAARDVRPDLPWPLIGITFGLWAIPTIIAIHTRLPRFALIGLSVVVTPLIIVTIGLTGDVTAVARVGILGTVLVISGSLTLAAHLRTSRDQPTGESPR